MSKYVLKAMRTEEVSPTQQNTHSLQFRHFTHRNRVVCYIVIVSVLRVVSSSVNL